MLTVHEFALKRNFLELRHSDFLKCFLEYKPTITYKVKKKNKNKRNMNIQGEVKLDLSNTGTRHLL